MKAVCVRMRELRRRLGISQVEFAAALGVTNAHISKIEKGGTVPSDTLIRLISKEYLVNEAWLKAGEGPVFAHGDTGQMEAPLYDFKITVRSRDLEICFEGRGIRLEDMKGTIKRSE